MVHRRCEPGPGARAPTQAVGMEAQDSQEAQAAATKGEGAQAQLQLELTQLKEQLALMQQRLFGASSEKRGERPPKPPRAKPQSGHGPRAQPELKVQEVLLPLTVVERSFLLRRVKRQKSRCGQGCTPVTAPAPPRLIPGGRYSGDVAVHVALMKYGFHLPLARQERLYGRAGPGVGQCGAPRWRRSSTLSSRQRACEERTRATPCGALRSPPSRTRAPSRSPSARADHCSGRAPRPGRLSVGTGHGEHLRESGRRRRFFLRP